MASEVPGSEKEVLRKMMQNEQAEGAIRDCIKIYQQSYMENAMKLRGAYLAYYACGFSAAESLMLTIQSIE